MATFSPAPALSAYRHGDLLYIPRGASLPPSCVKCGGAAERPWRKTFSWHPQWILIFVLIGLLIYAILAVIMRKKLEVIVPLCAKHEANRKQGLITGGILMLLGIPLGIVLGHMLPGDAGLEIGILVGAVTFFAGVIFYSKAANYLQPAFIDDFHGEFKGACEEFLQQLPSK